MTSPTPQRLFEVAPVTGAALPRAATPTIGPRTPFGACAEEKVVMLSGHERWDTPYIYMTGHGNVRWGEQVLATVMGVSLFPCPVGYGG
jgi:hypothetical protein